MTSPLKDVFMAFGLIGGMFLCMSGLAFVWAAAYLIDPISGFKGALLIIIGSIMMAAVALNDSSETGENKWRLNVWAKPI